MTRRMHALAATAALLLLVLAEAQGMPPVTGPSPSLVGRWSTELPNPGGVPLTGTVTYRPDGTYEESMTAMGEVVGWWRGTYTLAPDGTLILTETATSPELCFQGRCQPNEGPTRTTARIGSLDASSYTAWYETGAEWTPLTFRRVDAAVPSVPPPGAASGAMPAPRAPVPTAPVPTAPPTGPVPTAPVQAAPPTVPLTGPVASPEADPWTGVWSDGEVTVRLGTPAGDILEFEGRTMPLTLSGNDVRLDGTVRDLGETFAITLERVSAGLVVSADGFTFLLSPTSSDGAPAPGGFGSPPGD